ncbi:MAG: 16S rRNA (cytosine(1402)-N(4))-methyltransferase RsmH [Candidatus Fermentibacter sp.]|nr:16S rRNA (cytosine(1402)-N(4))-methyltransferase RsmH [Candidatus Fermentibacter sp.]
MVIGAAGRAEGHRPVMAAEVAAFLRTVDPGLIVDGTAGGGGHLRHLMEVFPSARFIAVDRDPDAAGALPAEPGRLLVRNASYTDLPSIVAESGFGMADAALFDLGLSSLQLDDPSRGFSHRLDGPLDMRFSREEDVRPAGDILNGLPEREIADILFRFGEEGRSRIIARAIVASRPLESTSDLVRAVRGALRGNPNRAMSRIFQALRIAVNDELGALSTLLAGMGGWVRQGGLAAVITFHSIEDRMVKRFFMDSGVFAHATPPWEVPSRDEARTNPRARSARLRRGVRL